MSKLLSLLMVMAMMFMMVPVSALAANDADTAAAATDKDALVLVTSEVPAPTDADKTPADTTTPAVTAPATTTPATTTPATTTPATTAPATTTPATTTPATTAPATTTPATPTPAVETPVVQTAAIDETIDTLAATVVNLTLTGGTVVNLLVTNTGAGYSFDNAANTLTLDNFTGQELDVVSNADLFKLVLHGVNKLTTNAGFAIDVDGSINLSGDGRLTAEGAATALTPGGGLCATQDISIDSGYYDFNAIGNAGTGSAVGIFGTNATSDIMFNGGYTDVTAINPGASGAYGVYSYGDVYVNKGDLDVITDSAAGTSWGIGAADDIVFNGGYTTVDSKTATGEARALHADSWVVINRGILDLQTSGGVNPLAIQGHEGVYINPCYGPVDLSASCLYLEPLCGKHFRHHHAATSNPKTGVETTATDAIIAGLALISLMGLAIVMTKRETNV
jgi:LPXTG-motif cell wall-anchored protein